MHILIEWGLNGRASEIIKARRAQISLSVVLLKGVLLAGPFSVFQISFAGDAGKNTVLNVIIGTVCFALGWPRQKSREWEAVGIGSGLFLGLGVFTPMVGHASMLDGSKLAVSGVLGYLSGWLANKTYRLGRLYVRRYFYFVVGWRFFLQTEQVRLLLCLEKNRKTKHYRVLRAREKSLWRTASVRTLRSYSRYRARSLGIPAVEVHCDTLRRRDKRSAWH